MSVDLPAEFWHNVSESRRLRLKRRTRRLRLQGAFWGIVSGYLIATGVLHNDVPRLFWGAILFLALSTYLLIRTSPRRAL